MYIHLYVSVNPFSPRLSLSLSLSFLSSLPRLLRSFLSRRFFFLPPCQSSPSVSVSLFPHFYLSLYATSFPSFVSFESVSHCWCVRVCVSVRVCARRCSLFRSIRNADRNRRAGTRCQICGFIDAKKKNEQERQGSEGNYLEKTTIYLSMSLGIKCHFVSFI